MNVDTAKIECQGHIPVQCLCINCHNCHALVLNLLQLKNPVTQADDTVVYGENPQETPDDLHVQSTSSYRHIASFGNFNSAIYSIALRVFSCYCIISINLFRVMELACSDISVL